MKLSAATSVECSLALRLRRRHEFCFLLFLGQDCARCLPRAARQARKICRVSTISLNAWRRRSILPMPKIYVIPTDSPNAFATGRNPNHASVASSRASSDCCTDDELEGVLAHELGHVRNRGHHLISSIAATLAGAITYLASIARWSMIFGGMRG